MLNDLLATAPLDPRAMTATRALATPSAHLPALVQRLREDLPVLLVSSLLLALCLGLFATKGIYFSIDGVYQNSRLYLMSFAVVAVIGAVRRLAVDKPLRPSSHIVRSYFGDSSRFAALAGALPGLLVLCCFMPFFSALKSAIPLFNAYDWDRTFIDLERSLLLGHDAWQLLQPVLGHPLITSALSVFYHLWILLCYPGAVFMLLAPIDNRLRRRFLLGFVLAWALIGGIMAILLASYGPCFVGPLAGMPDFDGQMAYLRAANEQYPVFTLEVQKLLAARFHEADNGLGSGISAMPSMHIAMCWLFYLAWREVNPRLGKAVLAFTVLIWIGSVHLAYHYALDGVVSVLAMTLIWNACGALIDWWDRKTADYAVFRTNTVPAE